MTKSPTFGSLFSGIGGLDLGLERAGWECRWQSEIDPYASKVLAKHWPNVPNVGDVKTADWSSVEHVDLICGGFPCQPVSRAGRRMAQADDRWLWPEYARVVRTIRPRFVLVENVPGLLVHAMGDVLGDLATLGYDADWESIPAAAVGALHIRDRVWIVAHARGQQRGRWPAQQGDGRQAPLGGEEGDQPGHGGGTPSALDDAVCGRHGSQEGEVFPRGRSPELSSWWAVEPDVGRVADGVPARMDRLRCLGNAVVPQVAEWIGRRILEAA